MPKTSRNPPRPNHTNLHLPTPHPAQAQILAHPAPHKLLRAGRRFGKTTLAAEYLSYGLLELAAPTAYLAPTYKMLQTQWRALKTTFAPLIQTKSETEHWLQLTTGGQLTMWSLDLNPDAVRGKSFASLFIDEAAMIRNLKPTWHQILLPTLLDRNGHALIVSTPRGKNDFRLLEESGTFHPFHFTTHANPLLSPQAIQTMEKNMLARAVQQEIYAEYIDNSQFALWQWDTIERNRLLTPPPNLAYLVVAVDPAGSHHPTSDQTGIIVAGKSHTNHFYILEDATLTAAPPNWAAAVINQFHRHQANKIVAEKNFGGDMVAHTLHIADPRAPIKLVTATRGKAIRAEPIAVLYEQNRVHHVGHLPHLETEMTTWSPKDDNSPNRIDALVWALTELSAKSPLAGRPLTIPF